MEVPIVGRAAELGQLRAALVAVSGGAGRLVLVSGEPGIGKTRLVAAVAEMAGEYGVPVAAGFAGYAIRRAGIRAKRSATAAPTSRSSRSGKETTLILSARTANRKPIPFPTMMRVQPAGVVKMSLRNCPTDCGDP